jgi:hypothetical protein
MLPITDFYGIPVTRLILGDNPFNGHSYITAQHSGDEMLDYYTADKVLQTLFEAEENGINTCMPLADTFVLRLLRQYRREGGKMQFIFQPYPAMNFEANLKQMMKLEPIGIYHQGSSTDAMTETGREEEIIRRIALIREAGIKVGLGTHVPETVLMAERENWDVDFYVTCLYNARRGRRGEESGFITGKSKKELVFYQEDPPYMYVAIQKVNKPCIAFKVFAGGQIFAGKKQEDIPAVVKSAFTDVYRNIKSCDVACVGVFQKHADQLKENAGIAASVLSGLTVS